MKTKRSARFLAIAAAAAAPLALLQIHQSLSAVDTQGLAISTSDIQSNLLTGRDDNEYAS